jgi:predicted RNA-binding protein YlxR (DUF448 family)
MTEPQRTCVGCMRRDSKERMVRIVSRGDTLTLDEKGRMQGRGAYLHNHDRCITDFVRNRAKEVRSLKRKISFDERRRLAELIHARPHNSAALE